MVADVVTRGVDARPDAGRRTSHRHHDPPPPDLGPVFFPAEQIRIVHGYWAVSPHHTEVQLRQIGIERLVHEQGGSTKVLA